MYLEHNSHKKFKKFGVSLFLRGAIYQMRDNINQKFFEPIIKQLGEVGRIIM